MKVAIVHYWLVGMRGGEKVLETLCEIYPQADIYTHVVKPETLSETLRRHKITTTFIQSLPRADRWYQRYLPLMPLALEQLDLRGYDLVISSESGPAKGIIVGPDTTHICYCHTPMRYVWEMYHDYRQQAGRLTRFLMPPLVHYLRQWDLASAARVDHFVANSQFVARRIAKHYRRQAEVIHPPVDTALFSPRADVDDYYLMVGQLVDYKRADLAVQAFNRLGKPLIVIGEGEQLERLRSLAAPNVRLLGRQPFEVIREHYARCRALIFPGVEDFGIVPLEAMASGRPVLAFGKGGALETVVDGVTGLLFHEQSETAIVEAVTAFEQAPEHFVPERLVRHAASFDKVRFKQQWQQTVARLQNGSPVQPPVWQTSKAA
jgi:glycosyltransferase involved in cell wall biosynthesis